MKTLTQIIRDNGMLNRVLSDSQLARLVSGSPQRRHHLVNRAMKAGELIRLKRGLYTVTRQWRDYPTHPFTLAQALMPGSYVSLETALAFHGWIPETVFTTANIVPSRKSKDFTNPEMGKFTFHPLAIEKGYFMELVARHTHDQQTFLMAKPVRALMDLVCLRKQEWSGLDWLTEGLRIDEDHLRTITSADIRTLTLVYKQQRMKKFLAALARELGND